MKKYFIMMLLTSLQVHAKPRSYVIPENSSEKGVQVTRKTPPKEGIVMRDPTLDRSPKKLAAPKKTVAPTPKKIAKAAPMSFQKQTIRGDLRTPRVQFFQERQDMRRSGELFGRNFGDKLKEDLARTIEQ